MESTLVVKGFYLSVSDLKLVKDGGVSGCHSFLSVKSVEPITDRP